jgi:hypothetical protein
MGGIAEFFVSREVDLEGRDLSSGVAHGDDHPLPALVVNGVTYMNVAELEELVTKVSASKLLTKGGDPKKSIWCADEAEGPWLNGLTDKLVEKLANIPSSQVGGLSEKLGAPVEFFENLIALCKIAHAANRTRGAKGKDRWRVFHWYSL